MEGATVSAVGRCEVSVGEERTWWKTIAMNLRKGGNVQCITDTI